MITPSATARLSSDPMKLKNAGMYASASPTIKPPKLKQFVEAVYPEDKKKAGVEAHVTMSVEIDETGKVGEVEVTQSGGSPDFDAAAAQRWDAQRYYNDANYAVAKDLVRPYRVGVSCGSCHIAFDPLRPPADPANPRWENLASAIGNQYIREGRAFANLVKEGGLFWEMLKLQPPGTSDTSRVANDQVLMHMTSACVLHERFGLAA